MPTFSYRVRTAQGQTLEATFSAVNQQAALRELHKLGYFVLDLRQEAERMPVGSEGMVEATPYWRERFNPGLPAKALGYYFRSFWAMLHAGQSVYETTSSLAQTARHPILRQVSQEMAQVSARGGRLSSVLERYQSSFPPLVHALIATGEQTGKLSEVVRHLAEYFEEQYRLKIHFSVGIFYPLLLVVLYYLIPPMSVFIIPIVTGANHSFFALLLAYLLAVLKRFIVCCYVWLPVALFFFVPRLARLFGPVHELYDRLALRLPKIGEITRRGVIARWSRAAAMLWEAGLPLAQVIEVSAYTSGNRAFARDVLRLVPAARAGTPLSGVLSSLRDFPEELRPVIVSGERGGQIGEMLRHVSEISEQEADAGNRKLGVAVGVAFLLFIALVIAFAYLAAIAGYFGNILKLAQ